MNRYIEARQRRAQKRVTLCDEIGHPKIEDFGAKLHQNGAQECSEANLEASLFCDLEKLPTPGAQHSVLAQFGRTWVPSWEPLGAKGVP